MRRIPSWIRDTSSWPASLASNLIAGGIGGIIVAIWSWTDGLRGSTIAVYVICAFASIAYVLNTWKRFFLWPDDTPHPTIYFAEANHKNDDPSGTIRTRFSVRNPPHCKWAEGITVRITGIMPCQRDLQKIQPYSTQFNDKLLKIEDIARDLNAGAGVEVFFASIRPEEPDRLYFFLDHGECHMPRGELTVTVVASAKNGIPDERSFLVRATESDLQIELLSPTKPPGTNPPQTTHPG